MKNHFLRRIHGGILLTFLPFIFSSMLFAQNVGINTTGNTPHVTALFDIDASPGNNLGLLIPRVPLTATNSNLPIGGSIATSLLVYNTATAGVSPNNVLPGFYYWNSTKWVALGGGTGGMDWSLLGNAGTTAGTNFIGTTDNKDLVFKRNNVFAGKLNDSLTSFGINALLNNTTGKHNNAFGYNALNFNTTGIFNSAFGTYALERNTSGDHNTASGKNALRYNTTGYSNCSFGAFALENNTTGTYNMAAGNAAIRLNVDGSYNCAYGALSLDTIVSGNYNTAIGYTALSSILTGSSNTAIGAQALSNNTTGSNNIGIGYQALVPNPLIDNQIRMGNAAITYAGIQIAWTITSDKRLKANIQKSDLGLNFIKELNPVLYTRTNDKTGKIEYGLIAQELEAALQKSNIVNSYMISKDAEGMYGIRYNDLITPLIKAIQEQQNIIENLINKNLLLEARFKALEDELSK